MERYVLDASVAVEYLLKSPLGLSVADTLEGSGLIAPGLIDAEVTSALRRAVLRGIIEEPRARSAVSALVELPVDRIDLRSLAPIAWQHYQNVTAYDAFYVAAARVYGVPVLTADRRLARAPGLGISVEYVRMA